MTRGIAVVSGDSPGFPDPTTQQNQTKPKTTQPSNLDQTMADEEPTSTSAEAAAPEEEDEDDLEKLQAEIAKMEEEARRIARETEDLDKPAAASAAASSKGEAKEGDKINKDG